MLLKLSVIAVLFGVILWFFLGESDLKDAVRYTRMAEAAPDNLAKYREMNRTAFVLGSTGEVGKELVKQLLQSKVFSRLVLVGRREVQYTEELYKDVEQKVVDFEKIEEFEETFSGMDVGFCCLGTTRGKAGAKGFYRVDHDYVVNSAKVAHKVGCKEFHLVSSAGADKKSSFLYPKTKGEVEDELSHLGFDHLYIYRPALLLCDRQESRAGEAVIRALFKPIAWIAPTLGSVPTSTVAKAMINMVVTPSEEKVQLLDNKMIHQVSGDLNKK